MNRTESQGAEGTQTPKAGGQICRAGSQAHFWRPAMATAIVLLLAGTVEAGLQAWNGWDLRASFQTALAGGLFMVPVGLGISLGIHLLREDFWPFVGKALPPNMASISSPSQTDNARLMAISWSFSILPTLLVLMGLKYRLFRAFDPFVNRGLASGLLALLTLALTAGALVLFLSLSSALWSLLRHLPSSLLRHLTPLRVNIFNLAMVLGLALGTIFRTRATITATPWEPWAAWGSVLLLAIAVNLFVSKVVNNAHPPYSRLPSKRKIKRPWRLAIFLLATIIWYLSLHHLVIPQSVRLPLLSRCHLSSVVFKGILNIGDLNGDGLSSLLTASIQTGAGHGGDGNLQGAFSFRPLAPPRVDPQLPQRPHLLLITVDALRYDRLGAAGYHREVTPNLDRLAEDGVLFHSAYCHTPATRWMIPLLLTSRYPSQIEWDTSTWPHTVRSEVETLPSYLRDAGYHTEAIWTYLAHMGLNHYFDRFDHSLRRTHPGSSQVTNRAIALFERHQRQNPDQPLFLWVHYFDPHHPYRPREGFEFGQSDMDRYDGEVAATDEDIGRLLDYLRESDLYKETAILVTADHGEAFGEHGKRFHSGTLYDEMVRIPMILRVEGLEPGTSNVPCGLIDVTPTLLSLVPEFDRWDNLMGHSLLDLDRPDDMAVFGTLDFVKEYKAPERMMVPYPGRMKLIANFDNGLIEYYDLEADPGERRNLADRRRHEVNELLPKLEAWFQWVVSDGTL